MLLPVGEKRSLDGVLLALPFNFMCIIYGMLAVFLTHSTTSTLVKENTTALHYEVNMRRDGGCGNFNIGTTAHIRHLIEVIPFVNIL